MLLVELDLNSVREGRVNPEGGARSVAILDLVRADCALLVNVALEAVDVGLKELSESTSTRLDVSKGAGVIIESGKGETTVASAADTASINVEAEGTAVKVVLVRVHNSAVVVDLEYKSAVVLPNSDFTTGCRESPIILSLSVENSL